MKGFYLSVIELEHPTFNFEPMNIEHSSTYHYKLLLAIFWGKVMSSLSAFIFQALDTRFSLSPFIDFRYFLQVERQCYATLN